jgi:pyridoxamine 5'-phosphate oxidase
MSLLDADIRNSDPINLFHQWFEEAKSSEPSDPDAACLATAHENCPSARMVLVRRVDARGFVFFTNENSRKGQQMKAGAYAALCYHWKSLGRQVRVEGAVEYVSDSESDEYYASRPRGSRIGAWASDQSQVLESRDTLVKKAQEIEKKFEGADIPRPPFWRGFRVIPSRIEFWESGEFRLHDRFIFTKAADGWDVVRLYP